MRVATLDIGTNTVLLLVAEVGEGGALTPVEERATITRLGQGVDRTRALAPEAIARTLACLETYAEAVRAAGASRVAVVGTSAMRDARGGDEVRGAVKRLFGVDARVVSGDEEARLTFAGAVSGLALAGDVLVFDIGGGSTEVVLGPAGGAPRYARSFDVGSVRLTERHVTSDPPSPREIAAVDADAARAFAAIPADVASMGTRAPVVGIAGTMTTLAAVALGMETYDAARVHGHVMQVSELRDVVDRLAAMPLAARRTLAGMEPKRADVIVAGGRVALAFAARLGTSHVRISDRGVRWGLALELASSR